MRTSGGRASKLVLLVLLIGLFATARATIAEAVPVVTTPCAKVLGENLTREPDPGGVQATSGASGSLPATGASPLGLVLSGVALILTGGALSIVAGRRGMAAVVIGLSILAGTTLIVSSKPAVAQTAPSTDACAGDPAAPVPVVPEAPIAALLPVVGLTTAAGVVLISRRRRPRTP